MSSNDDDDDEEMSAEYNRVWVFKLIIHWRAFSVEGGEKSVALSGGAGSLE